MVSDTSQPDVDDAVDALVGALDVLTGVVETPGALAAVPDERLTALLQRLELVRNRLPVVEAPLIRSATERELPERQCRRRTPSWLAQLLRIAPAEASRRVRAVESLTPRTTMGGAELSPLRPRLAEVCRSGAVSTENTAVVMSALESIERRTTDPEVVTRAEADLSRYAARFDPPALRRIADHLVEMYDPDGAEPDDEAAERARFFRLRQRRDSTWTGEFQLTSECGALLQTVLRSLSTDRSSVLRTGTGSVADSSRSVDGRATAGSEPSGDPAASSEQGSGEDEVPVALVDPRSHSQRTHDALLEAAALLLRAGELPASGGIPATVVVTVTEEQLRRRTGRARTADGGTLPVSALVRLAREAEVWPVVTTGSGVPLVLGRTRRLASAGQTMALIARDGGCTFPGCDRPPHWCERHHVLEWAQGGATDLGNLTLLCRYHHRHHLERGWSVAINTDGLPEWTPPVWIDALRRPLIHPRIEATALTLREARGRDPGQEGRTARAGRSALQPTTSSPSSGGLTGASPRRGGLELLDPVTDWPDWSGPYEDQELSDEGDWYDRAV